MRTQVDDVDLAHNVRHGVQLVLEPLLNEFDVARITNMSVASVRRWRLKKVGPRAVRLGTAIRYRAEDLKAWMDSRPTVGGGQSELRG